MAKLQRENLDVLVGWLDAMRRGDLKAAAEAFDPDVTWQGLPPDAICHNRREVLEMLEERFARGLPQAHALELVASEEAVMLGVSAVDLDQIGDVQLQGQLFNVFRIKDGVIVRVDDFASREEACSHINEH
jgi:ketosteroid isomerase-like protein